MKNEYKEMFEHISPDDELLDSILFDEALNNQKSIKSVKGKRLVAVIMAAVILCCGSTVGATVYFTPDSRFSQTLTIDDEIDLSTLGHEVNVSCEDNGYEFKLTQVLSDNNIFNCLIECPEIDGYLYAPCGFDIFINSLPYFDSYGECDYIDKDGKAFNSVVCGLRNIKNGDKITLKFSQLKKYNLATDEILLDESIEGNWEFEFKTKRSDVKKELETVGIVMISNKEFTFDKVLISPLGLYFDFKNIKSDDALDLSFNHVEYTKDGGYFVKVEMKDGTVYTDSYEQSDHCLIECISNETCDYIFSEPIDIDNIKSITIADNEIYKN